MVILVLFVIVAFDLRLLNLLWPYKFNFSLIDLIVFDL